MYVFPSDYFLHWTLHFHSRLSVSCSVLYCIHVAIVKVAHFTVVSCFYVRQSIIWMLCACSPNLYFSVTSLKSDILSLSSIWLLQWDTPQKSSRVCPTPLSLTLTLSFLSLSTNQGPHRLKLYLIWPWCIAYVKRVASLKIPAHDC